MKIYVTGRNGSGKSTFIEQVRQELEGPFLSKTTSSLLTNNKIRPHLIETKLKNLADYYREGDLVVVIDTAAMLCSIRKDLSFSIKNANYENDLLRHVTELPKCTIIKNNDSIDTLRVQVKKYIKKIALF